MKTQRTNIRDEIQNRSRWTFLAMAAIGFFVAFQIINLQLFEQKKWLDKVEKKQQKWLTIKATRGNIYATDGKSLLATSVPSYRVGIDPLQAKEKLFKEKIDSLAEGLAAFFGDKSAAAYKELIVDARKEKKVKFVTLGDRLVNFQGKEQLSKLPLFREGKIKGGGKFETIERRFTPFDDMAMRTIGKLDRKTLSHGDFGVEFSFDNYLAGKNGVGLHERIAGGTWKPLEDTPDIRPEAGLDVVTTIDVNFEDIVESALRKQVISMGAKYGSGIVMEMKTGEIKAMTNLSRRSDSTHTYYVEDDNYAVRGGTDPGSTFKLASMVALLEKANLNPNSFAANCPGEIDHRGLTFRCSEKHGDLTVKGVFEHSCNIGIYRLMQKHFGFTRADDYIAYLRKFRLNEPVGFQLRGETPPIIKSKSSETFSMTTIPWMSIGYETRLTPLQMLTFYNAIANNGNWVQPIIVKEIREADKLIQRFEANKPTEPICSEKTAMIAKDMMRGVVLNGTAQNITGGYCQVAGKTGTSQKRSGTGYQQNRYYTAFIGFFPADNPKYSCAIIIDEPQSSNLYARDVAAPVFKEIADKIFAYDITLHPVKAVKSNPQRLLTQQQAGYSTDYRTIAEELSLQNTPEDAGWVRTQVKGTSVGWKKITENAKNIPDLTGMTLRDALFILENMGYRVRYSGLGKVANYGIADKNVVSLVLK